MWFVIGLIVGIIIGWWIPQPRWAADAWQWIKSKIRPDKPVT